jgi:hypothetical protein
LIILLFIPFSFFSFFSVFNGLLKYSSHRCSNFPSSLIISPFLFLQPLILGLNPLFRLSITLKKHDYTLKNFKDKIRRESVSVR